MSNVRRVYVEKKPAFAVKARELLAEIRGYLGIKGVSGVRVLTRYDVENLSEECYRRALDTVFSEPPVDDVYEESFDAGGAAAFSVEFLPGQFDQRADSAEQCARLLSEGEDPVIRTAVTYVIEGECSEEELAAIKRHCINPVDSRESGMEKPETLSLEYDEPGDVKVFDGADGGASFIEMGEAELGGLYDSLALAMTFQDFLHIQRYFREDEGRNPTMTEIRVLDTYWSDHCRHTTFQTELRSVSFGEGYCEGPIREAYEDYLAARERLGAENGKKPPCLMDIALMGMRVLKAEGKLGDKEESDEINACSIVVPIEVGGETEEWLVNFKNETHNHPTEIEPFGGAATCLGGAIRDPLSGRAYVYQAMRVTGAADPTAPASETLKGKLPQKKIVREAARGYSSYGNQVGLATGYVKEIYHPGYVAKRLEIGAVVGAAPRRAVRREAPVPGDAVILLGGRTGRDGIGGATGSSKAHNTKSTAECGAEVQKGNPPTERKIQRLFRREEASRLIKKCNDFGAGGVSVAIGELADGLRVDLDKVPKKYAGLDGTELAISESQERMAVVVAREDVGAFLSYAAEENLEAVEVAEVAAEPRLVLIWRGKEIVNVSRAFLDTNGARQEADARVLMPREEDCPLRRIAIPAAAEALAAGDTRGAWLSVLSDLNVCSQKGLVEMFDSSIGAGSVLMPYGGKYQMTEAQAMVAKIPATGGETDAVTMMAYGFDPFLSSWSPFHGAVYAVTESLARIVASGGDFRKARLTFQEYFGRMTDDPARWGQPLSALLGAYRAQIGFGLPAIGGKDSMSGTFNDIDVPPTLVSFAVDVARAGDVVTPELKEPGSALVLFSIARDEYDLPDFSQAMRLYDLALEAMGAGEAISAYALDGKGLAAALPKMAFGNRRGFSIYKSVTDEELFGPNIGSIVCEVPQGRVTPLLERAGRAGLGGMVRPIGQVASSRCIVREMEGGEVRIPLDDALRAWTGTLEKVYPTRSGGDRTEFPAGEFHADNVYVCRERVARPRVFIPVFPGTNCEYDSARAFERAGAEPVVRVFRNRTESDIRDSVGAFEEAIGQAQIVMFPGGFSAGDEPEGSAKFFATAFRNARIAEAVMRLLNERDGLVLGICNGFQALIKLGLVPHGDIRPQEAGAPTLTYNAIGRHVSKMVYTKVVSDKSPWLRLARLGGVYCSPASHGEGRFVASEEWMDGLFANGQVATQYVNEAGIPTMDEEWNVNGSYRAIEGITSPDGRVFGKMAHAERRGDGVAVNIAGEQDMKIFESGVEYFR